MTASRRSQSRTIRQKSSKALSMHRAETATTRSTHFHRSSATRTVARDDKAFSVLLTPNFEWLFAVNQTLRQGHLSWAGSASHTCALTNENKFFSSLCFSSRSGKCSCCPSSQVSCHRRRATPMLGDHLLNIHKLILPLPCHCFT